MLPDYGYQMVIFELEWVKIIPVLTGFDRVQGDYKTHFPFPAADNCEIAEQIPINSKLTSSK